MMHPKVYEGGMNMLPVHGMVYVFRWLCNVIERGQASLTSQTEKKKKNQRFMHLFQLCSRSKYVMVILMIASWDC